MNIKNHIKTLCLITSIVSSMFGISGCHFKGDSTIYNPNVEKNETSNILEISKIVFTDTATVFYFDAYHCTNSGCWFSIAEKTVLQGSHQTYKITGCDGIELGTRIQVSESGHLAFVLYFEPVDKSEKTVDFKEGDNAGGFFITGIKLFKESKQPNLAVKCTLKGEVIDRPQSSRLMLLKYGADPRTIQWISIPIRNGKFEYILNCNYEELYELIFYDEWSQGGWRPVNFISEHGVINFELYPFEQFEKTIVEGGKLNKEYMDYKNDISNKYSELKPNKSIDKKVKQQINENGWIHFDKYPLFLQIVREDSLYQEWLRWKIQYIRERSDIVGYSILVSEAREEKDKINDFSLYADVFQTVFEPKYSNHPYTAQMIDLLTGSLLKPGLPFIDFTAVDFTGKPVKLSERIAGKPTVLHLWASWCGPCRKKGKELIPVYEEFRDKGFVVVGVAREKNTSVAAETAVKMDKYPWENLVELNDIEQIWVKYGIGNAGGGDFLIDENGIIVAVSPSIDEIRDFLTNKR